MPQKSRYRMIRMRNAIRGRGIAANLFRISSMPPVAVSLFLVSRTSPTIFLLIVSSVSFLPGVSTIRDSSAPSVKRRFTTKLRLTS